MKIECDELLVICDNCGHAIHVKELDNNLIKLNNKNDKLISEQDAIDALIEWYGCEPNGMDYFKEILAKKSSAQPERNGLTKNDIETIRIHLNAIKENLCNQRRWKEAQEYEDLIERLLSASSAQPERKWIPCSNPPKHHRDVIVRGTELIGNVTVHKVMQWDVDTWRPTNYAPSIRWEEWSEI